MKSFAKKILDKASEFSKSYGNQRKSSGEYKFHSLVATRGPSIVKAEGKK